MARGYIYEISTDKSSLGFMDESDFYDSLKYLEVDFVKDASREKAHHLTDTIKKYGGEVGETEDGTKFFVVRRDVRRKYFLERYRHFIKEAMNTPLDAFALDDPYDLRMTLRDSYGDGVFLNGVFYPLDDFMRLRVKEGVPYYIGNVVLMQ